MLQAANLDAFEPEAYLSALVAVAAADGITAEEIAHIRNQAGMLGFSADALLDSPPPVSTIDASAAPITRRLAYRDCFILAWIDGPPNELERQALDRVGEALGLAPPLRRRIEGWMERYSALLEEGEALLASTD